MGFKLVRPSRGFLHPATFLNKFNYTDDYERQYVTQIAKLAGNGNTRIHLLADNDNIPYGFIAMSLSLLLNQPCLKIDYLFTSKEHRGISYEELGMKVSEHLMDFAINTANEIDSRAPVRFIALLPSHDRLVSFYGEWGFRKLDKTGWMFLKI